MKRVCVQCKTALNQYHVGNLCYACQERKQAELKEETGHSPHYSIDDLCFLLGLESPESVKRLGRKGMIPGRVPGIKKHLYLRGKVDQWIRSGGEFADNRSQAQVGQSEVMRSRRRKFASDSKHFAELSVTALILASNFESYLDNFGTGLDSAIEDAVYGGWLVEIGGPSVLMRGVDRPLALNLLYHLKGEFPELADISDWGQLTSAKMSPDFIAQLKLKANRGDFMGKCPACPDSTANPRLLR